MGSILKVKHKRRYFPLRLLAAFSIKAKRGNTRNFYLRARRFARLQTINLDQNSFDFQVNVNYRLQAFRKSLIEWKTLKG